MRTSGNSISFRHLTDHLLRLTTLTAAVVSATIVGLVVLFLIVESVPALRDIGLPRFFTDESWHPLSLQFNLLPMLAATFATTVGAILIAGPVGIASAMFSTFYAPTPLAFWYRRLVELLAGIPSVVYGVWGLSVLVPLLSSLGGSGQNLLAATLVLALMILPTVALTADGALRSLPKEQIRGAAALGLTRWSIIRAVAVPSAGLSIGAGLALATARAVGETMAVLMVAGNVVQLPDAWTTPVRTLTANIALEMGYATASHRAALFVSGLILMSAVLLLLVLVEFLGATRHG